MCTHFPGGLGLLRAFPRRFAAAEAPGVNRPRQPTLGAARDFATVSASSSPGICSESLNLSLPIDPRGPRAGPASSADAPPSAKQAAPEPPPSAEDRVAGSVRRLDAALEALDHAISLQIERRLELADQEAEYSALQEDRSRLAQALDAANGRIEALQDNQGEAARRVERASAAVRAILASSAEEA